MITSEMKPARRRRGRLWWTKQRVVAVFSYRFDAHLVPDLLANLDPIVDGWIAYDDRAASGIFSSEPQRRRALLSAARESGADWVLAVDPDERFESALAERIGRLMNVPRQIAWGFRLRELYTPDSYRIDGPWGRKIQHRLFRAYDIEAFPEKALHGPLVPSSGFKLRDSGLDLYHLKCIEPRRRTARRDLYNRLDPEGAHQAIGYDYLADETGIVLENIPAGRGYRPAHLDDGGLWMADLGAEPARD